MGESMSDRADNHKPLVRPGLIGWFSAVVLCLFFAAWVGTYALFDGPVEEQATAVIDIPKGSSTKQIGQILGEARLIYPDIRFYILAKVSGQAKRLQAGEFSLHTGQRPLDVIKELAGARPVEHLVTIREGLRASEIARLYESGGWCEARRFEALVTDKNLIKKVGLEGLTSLEGYLYPDTYRLTLKNKDAEQLITIQVKRFFEVWQELQNARSGNPDRHKTVILASMVEKETGAAFERPMVASVFFNRLDKGMKLQSDPTVVYGIVGFSGSLTKLDLQTPTGYNTYVLPGLPVGPIANPGKDSLAAVLHPAETRYLYFVAKNDGTHQFSTSLAEHNAAVQLYQRKNKEKSEK